MLRILLLVSCATIGAACGRNLSLDFTDEIQANAELGAVIRDTQESINAGDVEAWVSLFDDEFRYLPAGMPAVSDRDSLWALTSRAFVSGQTSVLLNPVSVQVSGGWAIVDAEIRGRRISATGTDTVDIDQKQLIVYRQAERGWRISRMMWNANR